MRLRFWSLPAVAVVTASLLVAAPTATADPGSSASGGPGTVSHFDLARKDCLGTARNTTSKIWYTVANGVLSDVYAPTIDTTNVETMQYLVTDGSTFTDLQTRDTTYTVSADSTGMVCTVTSTAKSGAYRLTTTYLTDPARDSVVMHTTLHARGRRRPRSYPAVRPARRDRRRQRRRRFAATAARTRQPSTAATGRAVPVSFDTVTTTNAANRDYAVPSFLALRADQPFGAVSSGFVGTAGDGLAQLDAAHTLTPTDTATGGNVEQTAEIDSARR